MLLVGASVIFDLVPIDDNRDDVTQTCINIQLCACACVL